MPGPIAKIDAVWLPVTDMAQAVAFYRDALGLEVLEHGDDWSEVTAGDQRIGLNGSESPEGDGGAVLAFGVTGGFDEAVDTLKRQGVEFVDEPSEHPWGTIVPFKDPDGNDLQLYAPPS